MKNFRETLLERAEQLSNDALDSSTPIWRPLTSRDLSKLLGVSVQVLANWRVRDLGPPHHPARRGQGHKRFYRMDQVLAWLTERPSWEFGRAWLLRRGLAPDDADEAYVEWASDIFE
ncbi:helix-turn-helix domain-containing protein [Salipiger profundus]|uniref:helix-turn-helix domain-containing protein n=1 Tax=Salipiger profundus TaxID=1229727 RepID=UPI0008E20563|nr:helix-turn-helix domain-containing protein [Salipiger profundus]SFE00276.1 hypothetical protein SAMN05444415_1461 [Salipiger profundus]